MRKPEKNPLFFFIWVDCETFTEKPAHQLKQVFNKIIDVSEFNCLTNLIFYLGPAVCNLIIVYVHSDKKKGKKAVY